ncbi:MarR family transcriptional regulator [uncultured Paraglaciecola sp.]|jgi:DNA-binding MarR family transcriptional regulator|uniref:MarR family transcriptional regulator n=1 Tax=uncultured Paraglaciecola sp. TaxID=1765024 RepID=UPI0025F0A6D6|nr:MarR family transcriptional regulator [uncultured Paraglaciecola sp.]
MSTELTGGEAIMLDSQTLQLVLETARVNDSISRYLSKSLKNKGYEFATTSALSFLSTLECGVNYASQIARNLGVSRQMVAKTVKGLCLAGYLEQVDDVGKQKKIMFTSTGEQLMSDSRLLLADIDKVLNTQLSGKSLATMVTNLHKVQKLMVSLNDTA